jgi:hypothetical protein
MLALVHLVPLINCLINLALNSVHSSDEPPSFTVKPLLTGSNYNSWERSMRRALDGKMKFEFVDGMILVVTDQFYPIYYTWKLE